MSETLWLWSSTFYHRRASCCRCLRSYTYKISSHQMRLSPLKIKRNHTLTKPKSKLPRFSRCGGAGEFLVFLGRKRRFLGICLFKFFVRRIFRFSGLKNFRFCFLFSSFSFYFILFFYVCYFKSILRVAPGRVSFLLFLTRSRLQTGHVWLFSLLGLITKMR